MAGEWVSYDACIPTKPEILELVDITGLDDDRVIGRMVKLWGWASLNCDDKGSATISLRILARAIGADEAFLEAVIQVGWLVVNREEKTIEIPGWEHRFSKTAKSRQLTRIRAEKQRNAADADPEEDSENGGGAPGAHYPVRDSARTSAQERTTPCAPSAPNRGDRGDKGDISSSSSAGACAGGPEAGPGLAAWPEFRDAWNAGQGKPWNPRKPPDGIEERLAEPGWLEEALKAIPRIPRMKYFQTPPTLLQFIRPGFVEKANGGGYDDLTRPKPRGGPDDRPPPKIDPDWPRKKREAEEREARKRLGPVAIGDVVRNTKGVA